MTSPELLGIITATPTGATVTFDRHYATDPADLWEAVTDPERLARWFAPVSGDLRPGGRFTIAFDDEDAPDCELVSCEPPTAYSWRWPHAQHTSVVAVAVAPDNDGARLRIEHALLTVDQAPGYAAGWHAYARSLDAHVADDDREQDWWQEFHGVRTAYAEALAAATRGPR